MPQENAELVLKGAEDWNRGDLDAWFDLFADDVRLRSLAAGAPGLEFTLECRSSKEVARYFAGLAQDWEMIHYTVERFVVDGDQIAVRGSTGWRHRGII